MTQFSITGMSCAACQARVEKAVSRVEGVSSCSVSLLTNSMGVEGDASPDDIIKAVKNAGYGASVKGRNSQDSSIDSGDELTVSQNETIKKLKNRLIASVAFLIVLMYITMGHNMLSFPLPSFLEHNHLALTLTQMLLSLTVMIINKDFFVNGFKSLFMLSPNMDALVALGAGTSFCWSLFVFYRMCSLITDGATNAELMPIYHDQLYFESAAMIPALITIGKLLEAISKGKTTNALKRLMKLSPKSAYVMRGDEETKVDIEDVKPEDIFVLKPGRVVPVDGIVTEGTGALNESALTGESIPVDKSVGDQVSAATVNMSGVLKCRATRVGEDTTLSNIIKLVSEAAATKAPIARIADKVSAVFVPAVICIALLVIFGWIIAGKDVAFAVARGISVLVISCPCALGLATPVAIMVGNGVGAKNGILFKTSEALEITGRIKNIVFDKTGTITRGIPTASDVIPILDTSENELLEVAYSLESDSLHPLAKAITEYCEANNAKKSTVKEWSEIAGCGLSGKINNSLCHSGKLDYINDFIDETKTSTNDANTEYNMLEASDPNNSKINDSSQIQNIINNLSNEGKTTILFEKSGKLLGMIAVTDKPRDDSAIAIKKLKDMHISSYMLTGDNKITANVVGDAVGIQNVIAEVLPDEKGENVESIKQKGKTAMVGDGINDAYALTVSDVGIAIGAGTEVAIDSADIVITGSNLSDVVKAIRLSKKTLKNIYENMFWAFFYNVICIPLAAGLFTIELNPMIAAAAMSVSSVTVCLNALRLNTFK